MQEYGLNNIRNIVLLGHGGSGKTALAEAALFITKATTRLGRVDEGNTVSDYDSDEVKRKMSISLAILPCYRGDVKINIVDTPGYPEFNGEVRAGMRVCEGAVITVCAASGVEVGTEQVWSYCEQSSLPRFVFVNKMDRENANFQRTLEQLQSYFGRKCVPTQLPIGAQAGFKGIVDLLEMKAYRGTTLEEMEVPPELRDEAGFLREKLVEAAAEVDDTLIEKYLGGEQLTLEELGRGLREATASGKMVPVLAGSALQNIGISLLLDVAGSCLLSPGECDVLITGDSGVKQVKPSESDPLAALVFKTSADPYVGKLTYFRVYNGFISSNSQVWNATQEGVERIGQLFILRGKTQEAVPQLRAGDIGAVAKLNVTGTGDTLCSRDNPVKIAPVIFPEPVFSQAVYPKTKADVDKLGTALSRLSEEDPTLAVCRDMDTGETIISGLGETHLEVMAGKMLRKFGVAVELETPSVPYKETITVPTKAEYKHKKQTGGHGQYGHVLLEMEPLQRGSGNEFADRIVGGAIPKNYIPAVEKGVIEAALEGVLAHYPVIDVKTTVYDGSFHPVDSSEICFKIAGAQALKKGLLQAQPILLEPIVNIRVTVPQDFTGDIIADLNTKRARVQGMNPEGGVNLIEAQVPLAEVLRYSIDLRSITQGRGSYSIDFSHYEEVPAHIAQKIIAGRQAKKT
jgi:elongation factor G